MDSYQEGFKAGASASLVKSTIDVVLIHANLEHLIKDNYPPGNLRKRFREQIRYVCRQSKNYRPFMGFGSEKLNINFKKLTEKFNLLAAALKSGVSFEKLITPKELMLLVGYYSNIINELGYRSRIPLEDKELWISKLEDAFLSFMEETGYFEVS